MADKLSGQSPLIFPKSGERFSFSPGEKAGMRADVHSNQLPKIFFKIICPLLALAGIIQQMPDANDMDLVREFARNNSEAAFTELVRRHLNLVYSVARRCTGNDGDAHDVTQA